MQVATKYASSRCKSYIVNQCLRLPVFRHFFLVFLERKPIIDTRNDEQLFPAQSRRRRTCRNDNKFISFYFIVGKSVLISRLTVYSVNRHEFA